MAASRCVGSSVAEGEPTCRCGGECVGGTSSSNDSNTNSMHGTTRRRRRCFSSVPPRPAVAPAAPLPSPLPRSLSVVAAAAMGLGGAAAASAPPPLLRAAGRAAVPRARATASGSCSDQQAEERLQLSSRARPRLLQQRRAGGGGGGTGSRSLLSRLTTVAAVAVAVNTPVVGVGAVMTEAECAGTTLLPLDEQLLSKSPRPDTSTEAAAVGIDQTIVATEETYYRMEADQGAITELEGRDVDVPFRNRWSDHVWLGTAKVGFPGTAVKTSLLEGSPPEFNCMNEHYGLAFENDQKGVDHASGTLRADKVLNWDLLGPEYLDVEGVSSFAATQVQTVPSAVNLVAARERTIDPDDIPKFHYFLSEPAEDVDPSACPEPCTGDVVSYYLSASAGMVYLLDRVSWDSASLPCWSNLFEAVADGPPAGGVDVSLWEGEAISCTDGLLQAFEDSRNTADPDADVADAGEEPNGGGSTAVVAAVLIPALLVSFVALAFGILRHQKGRRLKKMMTTEEAWGGGSSGGGIEKGASSSSSRQRPRPPTGRFKLGLAGGAAVVTAEEAGIARLKSFPPPERVSTDVSIDEQDVVGVVIASASAGAALSDAEEGRMRAPQQQQQHEEDEVDEEDDEDMIYPM